MKTTLTILARVLDVVSEQLEAMRYTTTYRNEIIMLIKSLNSAKREMKELRDKIADAESAAE